MSVRCISVLLPLLLVGCPDAELPPETPRQPCALADGQLRLDVPVPEHHALVAMEGACMLIDEREQATFATLAVLPTDAQGAELLGTDPATFFREAGLLGEDARRVGRGELELLGQSVATLRWAARPEGLPTREITTAAVRRGAVWLIVIVLVPPGDADQREHVERLLAGIPVPSAQ